MPRIGNISRKSLSPNLALKAHKKRNASSFNHPHHRVFDGAKKLSSWKVLRDDTMKCDLSKTFSQPSLSERYLPREHSNNWFPSPSLTRTMIFFTRFIFRKVFRASTKRCNAIEAGMLCLTRAKLSM